ncbi:Repressor [Gammaproteobacteria bacterium]
MSEQSLSNDEQSPCSLLEPYAAQVLGDSMAPEFPPECIVIIDPVATCGDGAFIFAEVEHERWFRQYREEGGRRWLAALNPAYPAIELDERAWQVIGVIVQRNIRRKIKHYRHRPRDPLPIRSHAS